jgi:FAD binding domain/Berberine and berberine like
MFGVVSSPIQGADVTMFAAATGDLTRVAGHLEDKIVLPSDEGFDEARRAWNLAVDQRPAAVVLPESPQDVAAAIQLAREHDQRVAAEGTGHNAGPLGSLDDTILLKTERMNAVSIDPAARLGRAEAGVRWLQVVEAAAQRGLVPLAGSSPDVRVVGYTLGGGMSLLGRKYGFAGNNVHAIELVTADGRLVRADREHEADLFWALRGGGGSFGVVTALEFRLFPVTEIYAGILWYPIDRGAEVLPAWRELTRADPPDELTTALRFLRFPPIPEVPEPVRGQSFVAVDIYYLGERARADALIAPLRSLGPVNDTIAMIPIAVLPHVHLDPETPTPGIGDGLLLAELPTAALDALDAVAGAQAELLLAAVELRQLEGELGRARPENGALASLDAQYAMFAGGIPATLDQEHEDVVLRHAESVEAALEPWAAPRKCLNFVETRQPVEEFWPEATFQRLREIKATVDPDDVIRSNHPIPPAHQEVDR